MLGGLRVQFSFSWGEGHSAAGIGLTELDLRNWIYGSLRIGFTGHHFKNDVCQDRGSSLQLEFMVT